MRANRWFSRTRRTHDAPSTSDVEAQLRAALGSGLSWVIGAFSDEDRELLRQWHGSVAREAHWDLERGSLWLDVDGTGVALAVGAGEGGAQIESMVTLEETRVTALATDAECPALQLTSDSWAYTVRIDALAVRAWA